MLKKKIKQKYFTIKQEYNISNDKNGFSQTEKQNLTFSAKKSKDKYVIYQHFRKGIKPKRIVSYSARKGKKGINRDTVIKTFKNRHRNYRVLAAKFNSKLDKNQHYKIYRLNYKPNKREKYSEAQKVGIVRISEGRQKPMYFTGYSKNIGHPITESKAHKADQQIINFGIYKFMVYNPDADYNKVKPKLIRTEWKLVKTKYRGR